MASNSLTLDAVAVAEVLSGWDPRTKAELCELAFGQADRPTQHRVTLAFDELRSVGVHLIRDFSNMRPCGEQTLWLLDRRCLRQLRKVIHNSNARIALAKTDPGTAE